eukprot:snap_masked-scaffold_95-processed-gene-0.6-mRNA-1 protein AED:1.00 eAED:1.00 QI:0/0/0/0/1/1/2/0/125
MGGSKCYFLGYAQDILKLKSGVHGHDAPVRHVFSDILRPCFALALVPKYILSRRHFGVSGFRTVVSSIASSLTSTVSCSLKAWIPCSASSQTFISPSCSLKFVFSREFVESLLDVGGDLAVLAAI